MENLQQQAGQAGNKSVIEESVARSLASLAESRERKRLEAQQITDEELPDRPTVKQVSAWLGKSINTIYGWAREGLIPCKRVRRSYVFDKAALLEWARPQQEA